MILSNIAKIKTQPETGSWYRVTGPQYLATAIATNQTIVTPSRFYDPLTASPQFRSLYLADDVMVALFEAQALLGSPYTPGKMVSSPKGGWVTLTVKVHLANIVDFSKGSSQKTLETTAEELTGDWRGYRIRSPLTQVSDPTGIAPTQELGAAVFKDRRSLEGFSYVSAKVPYHRNLVVFPDHLDAASFVEYEWHDGHLMRRYRIDSGNPNGAYLP